MLIMGFAVLSENYKNALMYLFYLINRHDSLFIAFLVLVLFITADCWLKALEDCKQLDKIRNEYLHH